MTSIRSLLTNRRRHTNHFSGTTTEVYEPRTLLVPSLSLPANPVAVSEDLPADSPIVSFGFTDADQVSISAGDDTGAFEIDVNQTTATLRLLSPSAIDFESLSPSDPADPDSDRLIELTIRADDMMAFTSVEAALVLNVQDVAESPEFGDPPDPDSGWDFFVSEMASASTEIGRIPLTDPQGDFLNVVVYEGDLTTNEDLADPPNWNQSSTIFAYQDGTEVVIYVGDETLDFELQPKYIVKITARDGDMNSDEVIVDIFVEDELEWESTGIFVAGRQVLGSVYHHTAVIIIPDDQVLANQCVAGLFPDRLSRRTVNVMRFAMVDPDNAWASVIS